MWWTGFLYTISSPGSEDPSLKSALTASPGSALCSSSLDCLVGLDVQAFPRTLLHLTLMPGLLLWAYCPCSSLPSWPYSWWWILRCRWVPHWSRQVRLIAHHYRGCSFLASCSRLSLFDSPTSYLAAVLCPGLLTSYLLKDSISKLLILKGLKLINFSIEGHDWAPNTIDIMDIKEKEW